MSLLSLVQSVARRVKVPAPVSVVNSTDPNVLQLWELANEEGKELARAKDWQALVTEGLFTTLNQQTQPGAIPNDLRSFIPDTFWNRTTNRQLIGPVTAERWAQLVAFPSISAPNMAFRERGDAFLAFPVPPAGQTVAYEYVSNAWAQNAAGVAQTSLMQDTDTAVLDEDLIALGVRWRFRSANGLDYAEDFRTYETQKAQAMARDGSSTALSIGRSGYGRWGDEGRLLVGEGGFPGR